MYDILIIGGGPAGVSAANYARARGCSVLLLEEKAIGGLIGTVSLVSHYASVEPNVDGPAFASRLRNQLEENGTIVHYEKAVRLEDKDGYKRVHTDQGHYDAKAVICCVGSAPKKIREDWEAALPLSVPPCLSTEECRGKKVFVLGGSDGACKEALFLAKTASEVHIVQIQDSILAIDEFKKAMEKTENLKVHLSSELSDLVLQGDKIQSLILKNVQTGEETRFEGELRLYRYIGQVPVADFLKDQLSLDGGYIVCTNEVETGVPGIFAAGDCRVKTLRQVATAVSDGAYAGVKAAAYVKSLG